VERESEFVADVLCRKAAAYNRVWHSSSPRMKSEHRKMWARTIAHLIVWISTTQLSLSLYHQDVMVYGMVTCPDSWSDSTILGQWHPYGAFSLRTCNAGSCRFKQGHVKKNIRVSSQNMLWKLSSLCFSVEVETGHCETIFGLHITKYFSYPIHTVW